MKCEIDWWHHSCAGYFRQADCVQGIICPAEMFLIDRHAKSGVFDLGL